MIELSLKYFVPFAALMCMATLLSFPRNLRAEVDLVQCQDVAASVTRANRLAISIRHKIANAEKAGKQTIVLSQNHGIHHGTMSVSEAQQNLQSLELLVLIHSGSSCT